MALESPAYVISASSHSATLFRQTAQSMINGTGVVGSGDLLVSANGTPNMSVNVAAGMVWCPGTLGSTAGMRASNYGAQTLYGLPAGLTAQGSYAAYNDGSVNLSIAAADPSNPRIDLVVASIQDAAYAGSNNQPVLQVVTGTAAPSPSAPAAPASSVVLSQVAVGAGVTSITSGNLTETRPMFSLLGMNPPSFAGHLSTASSIPNNAWTTLTNLDTIDYDNYNGWKTAYSVYYPQVAGWYQAQTLVSFNANTTGDRGVGVAWNTASAPNTPGDQVLVHAANGATGVQIVTRPVYCAYGSYIRFMAFQNSGAALSTYASGVYCTATFLHA